MDTGNIRSLAEEKLKGTGLFLADVVIKPGNRIYVFLDGERDVTIDDCSSLSRHLNAYIPEEENYELMVSSCGADQPLKLPRQYTKHKGRNLSVRLAGEKPLSGKLEDVQENGIVLRPEKQKKKKKKGEPDPPETVFIPFDNIETAKVNLTFNK